MKHIRILIIDNNDDESDRIYNRSLAEGIHFGGKVTIADMDLGYESDGIIHPGNLITEILKYIDLKSLPKFDSVPGDRITVDPRHTYTMVEHEHEPGQHII